MMIASAKLQHFRQWVFWTGIFNILAYGALVCPFTLKIFVSISNQLSGAVGLGGNVMSLPLNVNNLMMINTLGIFVVFSGIFLIVSSMDIQNRAWFPFWEGLLRIIFFLLSLYFVIAKNAAQIVFVFGLVDLVIAIIYLYYIFTIKGLSIK
ncbi:MAG: hypothetical protein JRE92_07910 [Deltaproteobacteria bacterium]|jgi:hypothetical protein|nr:hypothetical protein [Deltaproteobacteria bacterium]